MWFNVNVSDFTWFALLPFGSRLPLRYTLHVYTRLFVHRILHVYAFTRVARHAFTHGLRWFWLLPRTHTYATPAVRGYAAVTTPALYYCGSAVTHFVTTHCTHAFYTFTLPRNTHLGCRLPGSAGYRWFLPTFCRLPVAVCPALHCGYGYRTYARSSAVVILHGCLRLRFTTFTRLFYGYLRFILPYALVTFTMPLPTFTLPATAHVHCLVASRLPGSAALRVLRYVLALCRCGSVPVRPHAWFTHAALPRTTPHPRFWLPTCCGCTWFRTRLPRSRFAVTHNAFTRSYAYVVWFYLAVYGLPHLYAVLPVHRLQFAVLRLRSGCCTRSARTYTYTAVSRYHLPCVLPVPVTPVPHIHVCLYIRLHSRSLPPRFRHTLTLVLVTRLGCYVPLPPLGYVIYVSIRLLPVGCVWIALPHTPPHHTRTRLRFRCRYVAAHAGSRTRTVVRGCGYAGYCVASPYGYFLPVTVTPTFTHTHFTTHTFGCNVRTFVAVRTLRGYTLRLRWLPLRMHVCSTGSRFLLRLGSFGWFHTFICGCSVDTHAGCRMTHVRRFTRLRLVHHRGYARHVLRATFCAGSGSPLGCWLRFVYQFYAGCRFAALVGFPHSSVTGCCYGSVIPVRLYHLVPHRTVLRLPRCTRFAFTTSPFAGGLHARLVTHAAPRGCTLVTRLRLPRLPSVRLGSLTHVTGSTGLRLLRLRIHRLRLPTLHAVGFAVAR